MPCGWPAVRNSSGAEVGPSLGSLVAEATAELAVAGVPGPRREALRLLADLMDRSPGEVALHADLPVPADLAERAREGVRRRARGEPMAYVTGWAGFRQLTVAVDHRVLIPRPETEQLVDIVLHDAPGGVVVDVGTGSGCIALSLAQEGHYAGVVACDRSAEALAVARANARRIGSPVVFFRGDLVEAVQPGSCQAIVSNPPYLTEAELGTLDSSVREWEPAEALASGPDGMHAVGRLVAGAGRALAEGGLLAMEVDSSRAEQVAALAGRSGWRDVAVIQDLFGRDRFVTARRGTRHD